jgi:hypothetical protein
VGATKRLLEQMQWRERFYEENELEGWHEEYPGCVCGECWPEIQGLMDDVPGGLWCARYDHLSEERFREVRARDIFYYRQVSISGYVYILKAEQYSKIGRTKTPDDRIKTLAIQLPFPVELHELIACDDEVEAERALHEKYAAYRCNGEWFKDLPLRSSIRCKPHVGCSYYDEKPWVAWVRGEVHV